MSAYHMKQQLVCSQIALKGRERTNGDLPVQPHKKRMERRPSEDGCGKKMLEYEVGELVLFERIEVHFRDVQRSGLREAFALSP